MTDLADEAIKGAIANGVLRLEQLKRDVERAAGEATSVIDQAKAQAEVLAGAVGTFEGKPAIVLSGYAQNLSVWDGTLPDSAEVRLFPSNNQCHVRRVVGEGKLAHGDYAVVVALFPVGVTKRAQ